MQNDAGLFKVGRSSNPTQRILRLRCQLKTKIALVAVLENRGHEEHEFHTQLREHHVDYEWFDGSDLARVDIAEAFSLPVKMVWPHENNRAKADAWMERFYDAQLLRTVKRARRRHLRSLKSALKQAPCYSESDFKFLDTDIARVINFYDDLSRYGDFRDEGYLVKPYTTDWNAMLSLLPSGETLPQARKRGEHLIAECISALACRWNIDLGRLGPVAS